MKSKLLYQPCIVQGFNNCAGFGFQHNGEYDLISSQARCMIARGRDGQYVLSIVSRSPVEERDDQMKMFIWVGALSAVIALVAVVSDRGFAQSEDSFESVKENSAVKAEGETLPLTELVNELNTEIDKTVREDIVKQIQVETEESTESPITELPVLTGQAITIALPDLPPGSTVEINLKITLPGAEDESGDEGDLSGATSVGGTF